MLVSWQIQFNLIAYCWFMRSKAHFHQPKGAQRNNNWQGSPNTLITAKDAPEAACPQAIPADPQPVDLGWHPPKSRSHPHSLYRLRKGIIASGDMIFNMGCQEDPSGIMPDLFWDVQSKYQRHGKRERLGRYKCRKKGLKGTSCLSSGSWSACLSCHHLIPTI